MSGSRTAGFGIVITGDDRQAASTLDALNKRIQAIRAPIDQTNKSLKRFSENTGLASLGRGFRDLSLHSQSAFESIGRIVAPLGAITSAASVAGLARLTSEWAEMGSRLGFAAQRAGMTAGQLSVLQGAAQLAGSSAESLTSGITALNDNLTNAAAGRAPEATMAFNYLGVAVRDTNGRLRTATDVLPELADKIAGIRNPTIQAQVATMLFGGAAQDLLPFLRLGAAGMEQYRQKAIQYGAINDRASLAANELRMRQVELSLAVENVGNSIAEKLAPVVGPMLTDLTNWIAANRELIGTDVANWVKEAVPSAMQFAKEANAVAQALGGWKNLLEGIVAINIAAWAAGVVGKFIPILRLLALVPGSGVTAAALAGAGIAFEGGKSQGNAIAGAGEVGLRPGMVDPETGRPIYYTDRAGKMYTPDEAQRLGRNRVFPGEGGMEALGVNPTSAAPMPGRAPITSADQQKNMQQARDFLLHQGWTPEQAAGILANLNAESSFNPKAVGDNGTSFGIAQWHADRAARFQQQTGKDIRSSSIDEQIRYLNWELTEGPEKAAGDALKATRTPRQAATVFSLKYERPAGGDLEAATRASGADRFLPAPQAQGPAAQVAGGTGTSAGKQETTVRGSAELKVKLSGFPQGTSTTASTEGDLFGRPKIETVPLGMG